MAFNELKNTLAEADYDIRSYLKHSEAYLELKVFKVLMRMVTAFVQTALVCSMLLLALFVFALAASYGIGQVLGNTWYGFAVVGLFFVLSALFCYLLRKKINKPLLRFFSILYFDKL
jgi:cbb3-type cytochrome oxidase subunit 1